MSRVPYNKLLTKPYNIPQYGPRARLERGKYFFFKNEKKGGAKTKDNCGEKKR